ncbi:MAG: hypothetical protein FJ161_02205 [Gammaproteobacteria bacterium]|nr:hypothetical protein [Gammaproteobacteria bacterium]
MSQSLVMFKNNKINTVLNIYHDTILESIKVIFRIMTAIMMLLFAFLKELTLFIVMINYLMLELDLLFLVTNYLCGVFFEKMNRTLSIDIFSYYIDRVLFYPVVMLARKFSEEVDCNHQGIEHPEDWIRQKSYDLTLRLKNLSTQHRMPALREMFSRIASNLSHSHHFSSSKIILEICDELLDYASENTNYFELFDTISTPYSSKGCINQPFRGLIELEAWLYVLKSKKNMKEQIDAAIFVIMLKYAEFSFKHSVQDAEIEVEHGHAVIRYIYELLRSIGMKQTWRSVDAIIEHEQNVDWKIVHRLTYNTLSKLDKVTYQDVVELLCSHDLWEHATMPGLFDDDRARLEALDYLILCPEHDQECELSGYSTSVAQYLLLYQTYSIKERINEYSIFANRYAEQHITVRIEAVQKQLTQELLNRPYIQYDIDSNHLSDLIQKRSTTNDRVTFSRLIEAMSSFKQRVSYPIDAYFQNNPSGVLNTLTRSVRILMFVTLDDLYSQIFKSFYFKYRRRDWLEAIDLFSLKILYILHGFQKEYDNIAVVTNTLLVQQKVPIPKYTRALTIDTVEPQVIPFFADCFKLTQLTIANYSHPSATYLEPFAWPPYLTVLHLTNIRAGLIQSMVFSHLPKSAEEIKIKNSDIVFSVPLPEGLRIFEYIWDCPISSFTNLWVYIMPESFPASLRRLVLTNLSSLEVLPKLPEKIEVIEFVKLSKLQSPLRPGSHMQLCTIMSCDRLNLDLACIESNSLILSIAGSWPLSLKMPQKLAQLSLHRIAQNNLLSLLDRCIHLEKQGCQISGDYELELQLLKKYRDLEHLSLEVNIQPIYNQVKMLINENGALNKTQDLFYQNIMTLHQIIDIAASMRLPSFISLIAAQSLQHINMQHIIEHLTEILACDFNSDSTQQKKRLFTEVKRIIFSMPNSLDLYNAFCKDIEVEFSNQPPSKLIIYSQTYMPEDLNSVVRKLKVE